MDAPTATTAWSADGVTFTCKGELGTTPPLGGYVALGDPAGDRLAQVLWQEVTHHAERVTVESRGRLLSPAPGPFQTTGVAAASAASVQQGLARPASAIEVGALATAADVPALLDARGFNRHTFLCGQSGSGKTYALGVLLEQLLLHTRLPLLVFDPNGDHVHLGSTTAAVPAATAAAYEAAAKDLRVLAADPSSDGDALRIRAFELGRDGLAALLALDPIADRDEYNALLHLLRDGGSSAFPNIDAGIAALRASGDPTLDRVRMRLENLAVDTMAVWSRDGTATLPEVWQHERPRAVVAVASGLAARRDRVALAVAVLQQQWAHRHQRLPLLLVVDEAHDVCPAVPADPLQALAVELFTRVAGEGRKYGIHLLLASQRPDKLPDNVLSQCDNLVLMRVNSPGDRAVLSSTFGYAPPALVDLAGSFGLGETLLAGKIAPAPLLARIGRRLTPEGGADVPTDWAAG